MLPHLFLKSPIFRVEARWLPGQDCTLLHSELPTKKLSLLVDIEIVRTNSEWKASELLSVRCEVPTTLSFSSICVTVNKTFDTFWLIQGEKY